MKEFPIPNFKYGLDTRKDVLSSQPGTLVTCENCHVNPGGEIEKRKTFASYADVSMLDSLGVAQGTYGIEVTSAGIVVFGSALAASTSITSITRSGTTATATLASGHGLVAGTLVAISGANQAEYNGNFTITNVTATTFDYTVAGTPATPATGTIVMRVQAQPTLASAVPAGVTYQQLKHPTLVNDVGEAYDATLHLMTSIVFSENFNGKAFACALFADTRRFLYYDGTLIQQSANGIVMTNRTALADLATDLLRQLTAVGWDGDANEDELGATQNGAVMTRSPPSDFFTPVPAETSTSGYIGHKLIKQSSEALQTLTSLTHSGGTATATLVDHGFSDGDRVVISGANQAAFNGIFTISNVTQNTFQYTGGTGASATGTIKVVLDTNGAKAIASFQITGNSGTFTLEAPNQATATSPTIDLCGGAVSAASTAALTAQAIARAVNDLTSVHGYTAQTNGSDSVFVYAPLGYDVSVAIDLTVTVTTGSVGGAGASPTSLFATISPNPATNDVVVLGWPVARIVQVSATCIATGGTAPYKFAWSYEPDTPTDLTIKISAGAFNATCRFEARLFNEAVTRGFKCVVTDSAGTPATVTALVKVNLSFFNFVQE